MQYLVYTHLPARLRNSFTLSNKHPPQGQAAGSLFIQYFAFLSEICREFFYPQETLNNN